MIKIRLIFEEKSLIAFFIRLPRIGESIIYNSIKYTVEDVIHECTVDVVTVLVKPKK